MRKWIAHWEIWLETVIAALLLIGVFMLFSNMGPIWREILRFFRVVRPFMIGFAIAYLLDAPSKKLEGMFQKWGRGFARLFAVLLSYLGAFAAIGLFLVVVLPVLAENMGEFAAQMPAYLDFLLSNFGGDQSLASYFRETLLEIIGDMDSLQELFTRVGIGLTSIGGYALIISSGLFDLFLGLVISLYMLLYKGELLGFLSRMAHLVFKERKLYALKHYFHQSNAIFYKFIVVKLLAGTILGTLSGVVLSLLGVNYAIMLGLIIGICNLIPYLGSICSFILTVLIAFFSGGPMTALLAGVFLLLLQQVDDTIIQPRFVGGALNLNPIMIIFAITIGGAYFGIGGMLLSVPLTAIIKLFLNRLIVGE